MRVDTYLIKTITNMHVGSGDINFDIIDNQVQRDPITNIAVIHASSLKGAYREAAEQKSKKYVNYIFGPSPEDNQTHQTGAFSFFDAMMISRPLRNNKRAYYMATAPGVIKDLLSRIENLGVSLDENIKESLRHLASLEPQVEEPIVFESSDGLMIEHFEKIVENDFDTKGLEKLLGAPLVLVSDKDFKNLSLPVIARNRLDENGISQNLWYEEVVPRESRFIFFIAKPTEVSQEDMKQIEKFEADFDSNHLMQFGANKSIGYGYAYVERISYAS